MSINRVVITGNLTRDAELRTTQSGTAVLSMGVAVNDRRKNSQTGEWEDQPNFIDCTMFGTRAQSLAQYLNKGQKVAIEGKLRWHQWEDRETGKKRSKIDVIIDDLELLGRRSDNSQGGQFGGNSGGQSFGDTSAYSAPQVAVADASVYDDEIPF